MNNFTKTEKYAIIYILSCIMKADGIVHPKEEEFMNQIYSNLAITISELEEITSIDDIQANHIVRSMTNKKKIKLCHYSLEWLKLMALYTPKK